MATGKIRATRDGKGHLGVAVTLSGQEGGMSLCPFLPSKEWLEMISTAPSGPMEIIMHPTMSRAENGEPWVTVMIVPGKPGKEPYYIGDHELPDYGNARGERQMKLQIPLSQFIALVGAAQAVITNASERSRR